MTMSRRTFPMLVLMLVLMLVALVAAAGCGDDGGADDNPKTTSTPAPTRDAATTGAPKVELREIGSFEKPVLAIGVPDSDDVLVVQQGGKVLAASGMTCSDAASCPDSPVSSGTTVLDLTDSVSGGNEQGLLGLAFHPTWPDDPRIFINYTDVDGDTRIESWRLASASSKATGRTELLRIEQPYDNHNGGDVVFGPDGLLYIGTGDGGNGGDPEDRAQNPKELLGKMLRIDVDARGAGAYGIPPGNLTEGEPEIWAVGLRNPWRYSFDSKTGDLWIADVGQNAFEEINAVPASAMAEDAPTPNFGWRLREGLDEFETGGRTGPGELVDPVLDYGRDDGCSVTGGAVYRGDAVPALDGWYLYADFCSEDLRMIKADGLAGTEPKRGSVDVQTAAGTAQIASFGRTSSGEVLVVSLAGGVFQVVGA